MESKGKSVSKNYLYNTAYNILNVLIPLATAPYLSRILGTSGVGVYAYYFAIAQYFVMFAKLGLTNYGTRHISQVRDDPQAIRREFTNLYLLQIFSTVIATVIYLGYALLFCQERTIGLLFGIWLLSVAFDVDWLLFSLEEFKVTAIRNCIIKLLSTVLIFVIVKSTGDLWKYALVTSLSYSVGYLYLWKKCVKYISPREVSLKAVFSHIKPCLVLMIPVIALSIYRSMDKVMLGAMSDMDQTGLYEYAEKIIYCLTAFITSLGTVMMPKMANLAAKNEKEKSEKYIERSMTFIVFLSGGMCFGLMSVSRSLIPWFYGPDFIGSIPLMDLLSITLVFIAWANVVRALYVIPNKKDSIYIGSFTLGAVCNLIVNAIAIPLYGAVGACIGTIFAELAVPVYQAIKLHRELPYRKLLLQNIPFLMMGAVMWALCRGIEHLMGCSFLTMMVQVAAGGAVYLALSFIYVKKVLRIDLRRKKA